MSDPLHLKLAKAINRTTQVVSPDTKIFFIGFSRTATVSLHAMMLLSGIKSVHHTERGNDNSPNVAVEIERRLDDRQSLKTYLSRWTAFSDISGNPPDRPPLDGNCHFRRFDELFPASFFILNDRDTEAWIRSRVNYAGGHILRTHALGRGRSEEDIPALWRRDKQQHVEAVLNYFQGRRRFLHFRVDRDPPSILTSFLWPRFLVSTTHWRHFNQTKLSAKREVK